MDAEVAALASRMRDLLIRLSADGTAEGLADEIEGVEEALADLTICLLEIDGSPGEVTYRGWNTTELVTASEIPDIVPPWLSGRTD